jgi:hypothetical protein
VSQQEMQTPFPPVTVIEDVAKPLSVLPMPAPTTDGGIAELHAVATALNNRPRKTLNWRTLADAFNKSRSLITTPC